TDQVHHTLKDIAVGMAGAIPGIALAAIDIVTEDYQNAVEGEEAQNVEYSERPWLAVQHGADPVLAESVATRILEYGVGHKLQQPSSAATIEFLVDGAVHPGELLQAIRSECERLELTEQTEVS